MLQSGAVDIFLHAELNPDEWSRGGPVRAPDAVTAREGTKPLKRRGTGADEGTDATRRHGRRRRAMTREHWHDKERIKQRRRRWQGKDERRVYRQLWMRRRYGRQGQDNRRARMTRTRTITEHHYKGKDEPRVRRQDDPKSTDDKGRMRRRARTTRERTSRDTDERERARLRQGYRWSGGTGGSGFAERVAASERRPRNAWGVHLIMKQIEDKK